MASEPTEPVFDAEVVARLVEVFGDPAPAARLLELFLGEAPELVDSVAAAIDQDGAAEARRAAHSLKSSAATVGALRLSAVAAHVEGLVRAGQIDSALPSVEQLRLALDELREPLAAEVARLTGPR